jgi:hypothetical protein
MKTKFPYRVAVDIKALFNRPENAKDKEAALQAIGIRPVEVSPSTISSGPLY